LINISVNKEKEEYFNDSIVHKKFLVSGWKGKDRFPLSWE